MSASEMKDTVNKLFSFLRDKRIDSELDGLTKKQLAERGRKAEQVADFAGGIRGAEGIASAEEEVAQAVREKLGLHKVK